MVSSRPQESVGVTIVEILVVLSIIAIVVSIVIDCRRTILRKKQKPSTSLSNQTVCKCRSAEVLK